ncbi:MAG: hypothetical protein SVV03_03095, partial [Candidatus Nanohaloarchaea archaeon]|nr:hypothetical protein [Candidatus Nanohaloarchaea archaeon]
MEEHYTVESDGVPAEVEITTDTDDYVPRYLINRPDIDSATGAVLKSIKGQLIDEIELSKKEFVDINEMSEVKDKFREKAREIIDQKLPSIEEDQAEILTGNLLHEMLGLGDIELLLADGNLEELVVNSSTEPIWAYHKKHGWLKTDLHIDTEEEIKNYA